MTRRDVVELVMLVVLVATLVLTPVLIAASQVDKPHREFHLKHVPKDRTP